MKPVPAAFGVEPSSQPLALRQEQQEKNLDLSRWVGVRGVAPEPFSGWREWKL